MNQDLMLSEASFLLSHDAATGYIHPNQVLSSSSNGGSVVSTWSWFYSKNQIGSLYQQLNDGARALDLRPKLLSNGTVIFHHGAINIPISFQEAIGHAVEWCRDNPDELVLLLPSHFDYQSSSSSSQYNNDDDSTALVTAMAQVYQSYGITYLTCSDVYGWTIEDTMQAAQLPNNGGYLIALDGQDYYGTFCGKDNYVESLIVTCWRHSSSNNNNNNATTTTTGSSSCKKPLSNPSYIQALQDYVLQSANNPAIDDNSQLGPPANLYQYPFNELQALWQVDNHAVTLGLAHFSNLLEDTRASGVNEAMVDLLYNDNGAVFATPISLFAADNVANHGNALLSVLRNTCGQSILSSSNNNNGELLCGTALPKPRMNLKWQVAMRPRHIFCAILILYMVASVLYFFWKRPRLRATIQSRIMSYMRGDPVAGMDKNALYSSDDARK